VRHRRRLQRLSRCAASASDADRRHIRRESERPRHRRPQDPTRHRITSFQLLNDALRLPRFAAVAKLRFRQAQGGVLPATVKTARARWRAASRQVPARARPSNTVAPRPMVTATRINRFGAGRCFRTRRLPTMSNAVTRHAESAASAEAHAMSLDPFAPLADRDRAPASRFQIDKRHLATAPPSAMRLRRLRSLEHAVTPPPQAPGVSNFANKLRRSSSFGRRSANVSSLFPGPDWLRSRLERMHL
jgi:hypothetical protein